MRIIERTVVGKKSPETCEDGIAVSNDYIAVIDGSTSKSPYSLLPGMSNGRGAMLAIADYIGQMTATMTCEEFCEAITRHIHYIYTREGADMETMRTHPERRLTASAAVYSRHRRQVWLVGDCQAIVDGQWHTNEKPYEQRIASTRARLIRQGMNPQEARQRIVASIVEAMRGQNRDYAVIDGYEMPQGGVKVIDVQGDEVIMATDGYPYLRGTLAESEALLRQQLAEDPQCIGTFQATKGLVAGNRSFDDRAYVRIDTRE